MIALAAASSLPILWLAGSSACSSSPKLVGQGGDCNQVTDCEVGLICAPQKNGSRVCTNDVSSVQSNEPTPGGDAGDAAAKDGAGDVITYEGGPQNDSGQDSASPVDSGGD